ncbi:hypothetical protein [Bradyrhizobium sp. dw_411]|uniref:hypothetical protein n=1 Tax=Bradyrhizobium sp. dw_411 TaxID=2720082 RepID=UPI001BD15B4F|nr:hypothetical protein [Bradyrhizobium sp. dw_411]
MTTLIHESGPPVSSPCAPAMPTDQTEQNDRAAALVRMEQVVDLLRTCYVREGWKIDDVAAERALDFVRQYAKDGSESDEGREAALQFLGSHGQSLDWIFCGDVGGMICRLAKNSERATSLVPHPDAKIIELARQYPAAVNERRRLGVIMDEIKEAYRMSGFPESLRIRPTDAALGRTPWQDTDEFWHRPCDIDKWRSVNTYDCTREDTADGIVMTLRTIKASAKLQARAEEIVAAYDQWDAKHQGTPKGYGPAKQAYKKADKVETKIEKQIVELKATTIEGLIAKSRCAEVYEFDDTAFMVSVAEDLVALGTRTAPIAALA